VSRSRVLRIGVVADTHGLFDQAILRHFQGVDHILHAGDIGGGSVIEKLRAIAPVTVVSGNVDGYEESGYPSERIIRLAGRRIAIRHILFEGGKLTKEGRTFLEREQPDVCIFGHTHEQKIQWLGKTLLFNPGSAGPKRFKLTRGIALLRVSNRSVKPRLIPLSDRVEPH
jgi:putative phosphoesterase